MLSSSLTEKQTTDNNLQKTENNVGIDPTKPRRKRDNSSSRMLWWCDNEKEHNYVRWTSPSGNDPSGRRVWKFTCSKCGKETEKTDGYSPLDAGYRRPSLWNYDDNDNVHGNDNDKDKDNELGTGE